MAKLVLAVLMVVAGVAAWWSLSCCQPKQPPTFDPEQWWGPSQLKGKKDNSIRPFKIQFNEQMIQDLRSRLRNHRRFSPPLEGVGMSYGFNTQDLELWVKYWAEEYPFEARQKFLNQYPQYKTNIQGLDIHFIRVKPQVSAGVQVLPILMSHGWPGSVREFYEAIPLLTTPRPGFNFVFEVIIPSLPGYGFSDPAVRPGLSVRHVGVIMRNLMHRLGFKQYYVQGGDWGAAVASTISDLYPQEVLGHHTNMAVVQNSCSSLRTILGAFLPSLVVEDHLADRMYPLSKLFAYLMEEFGYFHLQATKPDTIGVGLQDSPAGLMAYILEKFHTWTTKRPDALKSYSKDQLIDNLMIYWSTGSITTSMRLYAESFSNEARAIDWDSFKTEVPTWVMQAKYELLYQPPAMLKTKYTNLLNTTVLDDGGHFLALQLPKIFAEDVFKAVKAFREWRQKNEKTEL